MLERERILLIYFLESLSWGKISASGPENRDLRGSKREKKCFTWNFFCGSGNVDECEKMRENSGVFLTSAFGWWQTKIKGNSKVVARSDLSTTLSLCCKWGITWEQWPAARPTLRVVCALAWNLARDSWALPAFLNSLGWLELLRFVFWYPVLCRYSIRSRAHSL